MVANDEAKGWPSRQPTVGPNVGLMVGGFDFEDWFLGRTIGASFFKVSKLWSTMA